jgi:RNA polymerase sigma factor (sigma-70 family)
MLAAIPSLRAFAISLTRNTDCANDLVQDTIVRAWKNIDRFQAGTNLNAWLFKILRNEFYSQLGPGTDATHADHWHLDIQQHGSSENYRICQ